MPPLLDLKNDGPRSIENVKIHTSGYVLCVSVDIYGQFYRA